MLWCCHMLSIVFVQLRTPASSTSSGTRVIPSMSVYQVEGSDGSIRRNCQMSDTTASTVAAGTQPRTTRYPSSAQLRWCSAVSSSGGAAAAAGAEPASAAGQQQGAGG